MGVPSSSPSGDECEVFLLADSRVTDIDATARPDGMESTFYSGFIPWLLFFRRVFPEYCWDNPNSRASLIIDDPLLQPRYGFLQYEQLLREMELHGFRTTIAHIPWNYRRIDTATVAMLKTHGDRISFCIHGCDHTGAEFGTRNVSELREKARTALEWSGRLQERTGLAIDPIMIFPQGVFSRAAIPVLKQEGYQSAVCTNLFSVDWSDGEIRIADLLDVAMTRYSGFPIFGRRYPRDVFPLAMDLFLGKPAFIAQHHDDFRDGYSNITSFLDRLNGLQPRVLWMSIDEAISNSALFKKQGPNKISVKLYCDRFVLRNPRSEKVTYSFSRRIDPNEPHQRPARERFRLDYQVRDDTLQFEVEVGARETAVLTTLRPNPAKTRIKRKLSHETKVAARRFLSEFRDNYLARNERLLRLSKDLKHLLPI